MNILVNLNSFRKLAKKSGSLTSLLFLLISLQSFGQSSYKSLTLPQAITVASENNLALKGALLDEKISKENTNEIRSSGLPQINAFGRIEDYLRVPTMVLSTPNPQTGELTPTPIQMGTKYGATGGIEVNQLIFSQSYLIGLKAAKTAQQLSSLQTRQIKEGVIYDLSMSYYGAQISAKQLEIAQTNLIKINKLIEITELQQKNGLVKKSDLNKLKVNRTNLQTQIQNLETQHQQQLNVLKFFMGLPIDAELTVNTTIEPDAATNQALSSEPAGNRTELLLINKQKELYHLEQRNILSGYVPSLSFYGRFNKQAMRQEFNFFDTKEPWYPSSVIGLSLNIPIFDGLQKHAKLQKSRLNYQKTSINEEQFRKKVEMELYNSRAQLKNSRNALATQDENRKLAEEIYAQTQLEYKEGVASMADLLNAETSMKEAQSNYINALIQTMIAGLEVRKANGSLIEN